MPKTNKKSRKSSVKKTNGSNKRAKTNSGPTRVYIGHVAPEVTRESLIEFIGNCGKPSSIKFVNYPNGGFKGIGFVDFASEAQAKSFAKNRNGKEFLGQNVVVKLAEFRPRVGPKIEGPVSCFIGNVDNADDDQLRKFAGGKVKSVRWITKDGDFKGYGFVEFATTKAADKFVSKNGQSFQGQSVRINYATGSNPTAYVSVNGETLTSNKLKKFAGGNCTVRIKGDGKYAFVDFDSIQAFNNFCGKNKASYGQGKVNIKHCKKAQPSQVTSCFVGGLPENTTESVLKKFAGANVTSVSLPEGKDYGFVHFTDSKSATNFLQKNGQKLRGSKVNIAYPKFQQRSQSGQGSL